VGDVQIQIGGSHGAAKSYKGCAPCTAKKLSRCGAWPAGLCVPDEIAVLVVDDETVLCELAAGRRIAAGPGDEEPEK
jgi:hypothetical protein